MAPPHTTTFFETACEMEDSRVIHPFAFRVHTHSLGKVQNYDLGCYPDQASNYNFKLLGKVVSGWKVSGNDKWDLIGKRDPQLPQMFYPVENKSLTISSGDHIASRCTMVIINQLKINSVGFEFSN